MEAITEKYIKIRNVIDSSYIENAMTYSEYRRLIDAMIIVGKSTAKQESQNLLEYSKLNVVRMNRLDKTAQLIPELEDAVLDIHTTQTWLVLTEGWCGDAAQIIPVLNKIADLTPLITLRLLLRDDNTC